MAQSYSPPSRAHRLAVWLVGFVVTGRVFHGLDRRDVSRLSVLEFSVHAASMCLVFGAAGYVWFVMPREFVSTLVLAALGVAVGLGGIPILTQWLVAQALEIQQLF